MFLVKLLPPSVLKDREEDIVTAAIVARHHNPMFGIYTDGLFDEDLIAVLIAEKASEEMQALLGGDWQPCNDAEAYEWSVWFAPAPTIKGPLLRRFAPGDIQKHYSRRLVEPAPLPLFEAA